MLSDISSSNQTRKTLISALSGEPVSPPPIWLMRQAGRYLPEYRELRRRAGSFLDFCFDVDLVVEATLQPIRRYGFDGAILFSDILVIPYALGRRLWFEEGIGPRLDPLAEADLEGMARRDVRAGLRPVYEGVSRLRGELSGGTALIGFAGAPWTTATYMIEGGSSREFTAAKAWLTSRRDALSELIDLLAYAAVDHLSAQVEAGAEALQVFDTWAGLLEAEDLRRWSLRPLAWIVAEVKRRHPDVPIILFPRGVGRMYLEFARESGADGLSLDPGVPLDWAREALQPHCAVQGNLDPTILREGGPELRAHAREIVEALNGGPFVFNLGHGVLPETPPDHVRELVDVVRGAGR